MAEKVVNPPPTDSDAAQASPKRVKTSAKLYHAKYWSSTRPLMAIYELGIEKYV